MIDRNDSSIIEELIQKEAASKPNYEYEVYNKNTDFLDPECWGGQNEERYKVVYAEDAFNLAFVLSGKIIVTKISTGEVIYRY